MRTCPMCAEEIQPAAKICKHCKSNLASPANQSSVPFSKTFIILLSGIGLLILGPLIMTITAELQPNDKHQPQRENPSLDLEFPEKKSIPTKVIPLPSNQEVGMIIDSYGHAVEKNVSSGELSYTKHIKSKNGGERSFILFFSTSAERFLKTSDAKANFSRSNKWQETLCTKSLEPLFSKYSVSSISGTVTNKQGESQSIAVCKEYNLRTPALKNYSITSKATRVPSTLLSYTEKRSYFAGGWQWRVITVQKNTTTSELLTISKALFSKYPNSRMRFFDDDKQLDQFIKRDIHFNDSTKSSENVPYPAEWAKTHHKANISDRSVKAYNRWQLVGRDGKHIAFLD